MNIVKLQAGDVSDARKAKYKKKKPTKPKGTITEAKAKAFVAKYNVWTKEVLEAAKRFRATKKIKDMIGAL